MSYAFYEEYGYLENAPERSDRPSHRVKEAGQEGMMQKKPPLPAAAQRKAELGY